MLAIRGFNSAAKRAPAVSDATGIAPVVPITVTLVVIAASSADTTLNCMDVPPTAAVDTCTRRYNSPPSPISRTLPLGLPGAAVSMTLPPVKEPDTMVVPAPNTLAGVTVLPEIDPASAKKASVIMFCLLNYAGFGVENLINTT